MRLLSRFRLITALLLLIAPSASAERAIDFAVIDPADHAYEHWYLDTIEGLPSGYWRTSMNTDDDDTIYSLYEEVSYEKHGGEISKTHLRVEWLETRGYQPLAIKVYQEVGSEAVSQTYRFTSDGIELTTTQNNRTRTEQLPPIQGPYLTAAQFAIAFDQNLATGETTFELTLLDPLIGMTPYAVRYEKADEAAEPFMLADGERVDATRWRVTYSILPGLDTQEWIDATGRIVGLSYDIIDGMTLTGRLADESVTGVAFDPPEMAHLSVVVPDRPIDNIEQQRRIVYELTYDAGGSDITPANTAQQSVEKLEGGGVRVTVDLDTAPRADAEQNDPPSDAHLTASIRIDHEDTAVRQLAERAVQNLGDDASGERIAKACKRYVTRHMNEGSLSVGDATASEAARSGQGDCTECAVLLAALLRAHGIPSRCVTGLVYSDHAFVGQSDVFVYHMWTQAWIENEDGGRWLDLDAAMWRYSAGHIALGVSAMGDGDQQDLTRIVPMMQGLTVKVIETDE